MKLSRDSVFHQLYRFTYGYDAGKNFCPFFWATIIALILFPFTWVSYPIPDYSVRNVLDRLMYSIPFWAGGTVVAVFTVLFILFPYAMVWGSGIAIGGITGILLVIAGITLGVDWFREKDESRLKVAVFSTIRDAATIVSTKKESFTEKYCPKIDWE